MDQNTPEPGRLKVRLNAHTLSKMLDIPDGARVVAVTSDVDPISVTVIVESPAFPIPIPDTEAFYVHGKTVTVEAGERPRAEWDWDAALAAHTRCPLCGMPKDYFTGFPGCPESFHFRATTVRSGS
jgi:hypothetical protein